MGASDWFEGRWSLNGPSDQAQRFETEGRNYTGWTLPQKRNSAHDRDFPNWRNIDPAYTNSGFIQGLRQGCPGQCPWQAKPRLVSYFNDPCPRHYLMCIHIWPRCDTQNNRSSCNRIGKPLVVVQFTEVYFVSQITCKNRIFCEAVRRIPIRLGKEHIEGNRRCPIILQSFDQPGNL